MSHNTASESAIDHVSLAGNIVVRYQQAHHLCHLLARALAAKRNSLLQVELLSLWRHVVVKASADHARRDTVHPNVELRHLASQATRELRNRALGRGIGDRAGHAADG